jgi:predicted extracellular nuclease
MNPRITRSIPVFILFVILLAAAGGVQAAHGEPLINEFVFNHTGTDTHEYVEVFGAPDTDYSALTIIELEGDGSGSGTVDEAITVGTTDAGGYWATAFLNNAFENGSVTLLLVDGFTGATGDDLDTDNDGVLDVTPWTGIVDGVAVSDGGAGDQTYAAVVLSPGYDGMAFAPGGASRLPNGVHTGATSDWVRNDFDGASLPGFTGTQDPGEALNTPGAENTAVSLPPPPPPDVDISEIRIDQPSTDNDEYFELVGAPGTSLDGLTYLVIGDGTGASGVIESVTDLSGQSIPGSGFFVAAEGSFTLGAADLTASLNFENSDNVTHLLVAGFSGANGDDLDTNDDGALDATPWTDLLDLIALVEEENPPASTEYHYGPPSVGPDGSFVPGHAYLCPSGWQVGDFNLGVDDTPGAANACAVPVPDVLINEIRIDQPGADNDEYFELSGAPGASLNGLTYLVIGEGTGGSGVIESVTDLNGQSIAGDGLFLAAESTLTIGTADFTASLNFENSDNVTHLLVSGFTGSNGDDLDTNDDGVLDVTPWSDLVDLIALIEEDNPPSSTEYHYGPPTVGPDGSFVPGHAFLCEDGWRIGGFTLGTNDTPGEPNDCAPTGLELTIMEIQGAAHKSPFEGESVINVPGVVTAVSFNGFWMQDAGGDGDIATSDGIFVFTNSSPGVSAGDAVEVDGVVAEFYPGGFGTGNLSTTEITGPTVNVLSGGNSVAPTVVGNGGRVPPNTVIDDDATGDVETTGSFDPATDGIDFYESLEGMLLQVNDALAAGPTNNFGEIAIVGDGGANASVFTPNGGLVIQPGDFNPERIILDDVLASVPDVNTGDSFTTPVVGVLDYSFGNFKLLIRSPLTVVPGGLVGETTTAPFAGQLSVASFNVENLEPGDPASKFDGLADIIVNHLLSPDIIGVQEAQDNTGPTNDGVVSADQTYAILIAAIANAGGPAYEFREIPPVDLADGGQPGANIRVGFLFRTDRGLTFVDRPGGTATSSTTVSLGASGVELSASPGRIDPTNAAWAASRKPLAGEFAYDGQKLIVVVNHFNSKGGDNPLFGRVQPPVFASEVQRVQQAGVINDFVDSILALDADANVVVLGDLNDFQFSPPLATLKDTVLTNLVDTLGLNERYSYIFDGNSQVLDHILVSDAIAALVDLFYDSVHVNADFAAANRHTDHDPQVANFCMDVTAPVVIATPTPDTLWPPNHQYVTVTVDVSVTDNFDAGVTPMFVGYASNEPDAGAGSGDKPDDIVQVDDFTFQLRAERAGTGTDREYTITYTATDACGNTGLGQATITVPHDLGE